MLLKLSARQNDEHHHLKQPLYKGEQHNKIHKITMKEALQDIILANYLIFFSPLPPCLFFLMPIICPFPDS
jgi:hypothetical protein